MNSSLKINCDLGEGVADEAAIFPLLDSASIACGGHFGTIESITDSVKIAKSFNKKSGAHPSYPDKENFGRKSIKISNQDLKKTLLEQIDMFLKVVTSLNVKMDHIKFHGALYNDASKSKELAKFLADFLAEYYPETTIYTPPQSELLHFASKNNLNCFIEVFGDRTYLDNFQLLPRTHPNSLLIKERNVRDHLAPLLNEGKLISVSGKKLAVKADTVCFHGDNPGLKEFLPSIRKLFLP